LKRREKKRKREKDEGEKRGREKGGRQRKDRRDREKVNGNYHLGVSACGGSGYPLQVLATEPTHKASAAGFPLLSLTQQS